MDANGTRFHLLLGQDDWASCIDEQTGMPLYQTWHASPAQNALASFGWDDTRMELTLQPRLFQFTAARMDHAPRLDQRRGAASDRYGNWYWISESGRELLVNSAGTGVTSHFWSAEDGVEPVKSSPPGGFRPLQPATAPTPSSYSGLAVTDDHYLVVGILEPAGLLIFDLHAGGAPRRVFWPAEIPFVPFDMAPMPGGGVWVLDREHARYWALDRAFNVITRDQTEATLSQAQVDTFQPKDGSNTRQTPARLFPTGITLSAAMSLATDDAIAIETLPDCTVLILDNPIGGNFARVYHYSFGNMLGQYVSTEVMKNQIEPDKQEQFRLRGYDFAFVPQYTDPASEETVDDRLFIVAEDGNQAYAFNLSQQNGQLLMLPPAHLQYYPLRLFGGKGLVATKTQVYYDFSDHWIPLIGQSRPRYVPEATLQTPLSLPGSAASIRPAFDGRTADCVWHRLMLDGCIPSGTQVQLWSRAANDQSELAVIPWQREPQLYLRGDGSEQPFVSQPTMPERGTWELLLQNARGRYLQLRLTLLGNERATPRIQAMRIYYPRFSYLDHYLPAIYREDDQSASFLERFLANPEGFFTAIEDKIASVRQLFTFQTAPAEALAWLASWFGIALDPAWEEAKQRLFIEHAMDFFRWRGTIRGLRMALRLAIEACADATIFDDNVDARLDRVRIVEQYRTRYAPAVTFGDPTAATGLRNVVPTPRWQPTQGRASLIQRFLDFLRQSGVDPLVLAQLSNFPVVTPAISAITALWQQFALDTLGFVPAAGDSSSQLWQDFLARRYHTIAAFNSTYGTALSSFQEVELLSELPPDGAPLWDWYQFETVVLAMHNTAHRFTVLLPVSDIAVANSDELQNRRDLAMRIINLEKPAHTTFTVKFYWALFRIGEARLGLDTLLDLGSRAPQLMSPMLLGQGYLSESYLAPGHPQNVADRYVLGRERLSG